MKTMFLIIAVTVSVSGNAQTFGEWTKQKKTQIKYLVEQIGAFRAYLDYAKKGYSIVNGGLFTIQNTNRNEGKLHGIFFNSLRSASPSIKKYARVADIISLQAKIVRDKTKFKVECSGSGQFTVTELNYLMKKYDWVLSECLKDINDLYAIITNDELEMKDDERMERIEKIYIDIYDKRMFLTSFTHDAFLVGKQKGHEKQEIILSKKLNGIK